MSRLLASVRNIEEARAAAADVLDLKEPRRGALEAAYLRIAVDKTAGKNERAAWTWLMDRIEAFGRERDPR